MQKCLKQLKKIKTHIELIYGLSVQYLLAKTYSLHVKVRMLRRDKVILV